MTLRVIAAGLGRNGTLSMKFALEALGFGPCHHMTEVFGDAVRQMPLWIAAAEGRPDWDAIFAGFGATSDYPSATFWRELAEYYPDAKVILTTRDPDSWFDSASETIFAPRMRAGAESSVVQRFMHATVFDPPGCDLADRPDLTRWYERRNAEVAATIEPGRLLRFHPAQGWAPLCAFLGVPAPDLPFPRANERPAAGASGSPLPDDPALLQSGGRHYIDAMRRRAFSWRG